MCACCLSLRKCACLLCKGALLAPVQRTAGGGADVNASLGRDVSPLFRAPGLAPFQLTSFRLQWPADLLTSCAFEMETLILGWYVLVETASVLLLSLFGALLYIGTLVAPLFGVV